MFKRGYVILVIFIAVAAFIMPGIAFSAEKAGVDKASVEKVKVEKADKSALLDEVNSFIDKKPDILRNIIFSMADEYASQRKEDEAIALYEKAINVLPDSEDLLNRLANLYNNKLNYLKAAEVYEKITKISPDKIWYYQMLSNAYKSAGQKDKAGLVWEDLTKSSKNAEVFMQAANFYSEENDSDKAINAIKKAIDLAPDNISYLQALEGYYMRADKFSEAEVICNKILTSGKEPWQKDWASSELINIYQRQNKLGDLAVKFEKDLGESAKDISKYRNLADLYQRNNELDKAVGVYEKAIASGLDDRDTNNRLLELYERLGKLDKAEAQLKNMIGAAPQDYYLYERLANLLNSAGKKDDAKKVWVDLLAKTPNDIGLFSRYGDRLNEWGDTEGAVAQYRKAQSLDEANLWYTMRIADIYIAKGKPNEAKKELSAITLKTRDDWLKKEAERKIKELEVASKEKTAQEAPAATVTVPQAQPETKEKMVPEAQKAVKPEAKQGKKKGFFSR